ncbi:hypothetical protein VTK56DRAFT_9824 [Thermocarpiscus australiensis]
MIDLRSIRAFPTALVTLVLVAASQAVTNDFSFYPKGAQDCLYEAADAARCDASTVAATNSCLCRNGGNFIINTASCLGRSYSGDLRAVYQTMKEACANSETPITITEADFVETANAAASSTSSAATSSATGATSTASTDGTTTTSTSIGAATTTTTTPTSSSPVDDEQREGGNTGLSTAAMAGIITGGSVAGIALIAGLAYFFFRRGKKAGEESHPMLPRHSAHGSLPPDPSEFRASPSDAGGWQKGWGRSSGFNWESPAHLSYPAGAGLAPSPPVQELDGSEHRPAGTPERPAEMAGTPIVQGASPHAQFQPYPGQPRAESGWIPSHR